MNSRLRDSGMFDEVWVQPAAGDAGTALGAALWIDARERRGSAGRDGCRRRHARAAPWHMEHAYLGPGYDDEAIEASLRWAKLPYRRLRRRRGSPNDGAASLAEDGIVGWFQGRMEFGPRALGARSILASPIDPRDAGAPQRAEGPRGLPPGRAGRAARGRWRDWFAPAAANGGASPFMLFVYDVRAGQARAHPVGLPHRSHGARADGDADTNPRFHALLQAFGAAHRRAGAGQHLVQRARRADRLHARATRSRPSSARRSTRWSIGPFIVEKARMSRRCAAADAADADAPRHAAPRPARHRGAARLGRHPDLPPAGAAEPLPRCGVAQRLDAARFEVIVVDDGHDRRHARRRRAPGRRRRRAAGPLPAAARRAAARRWHAMPAGAPRAARSSPSPTTTPFPIPTGSRRRARADADVVARAGGSRCRAPRRGRRRRRPRRPTTS